MIETRLGPAFRAMTAVTFLAVSTMVRVVTTVTTEAVRFELFVCQRAGMTEVACDRFMPPLKWKLCLFIVVKAGFVPTLLGMAIGAFCSMPAAMHVVQGMAGVAVRRRIFVALVRMAGAADNLPMSTFE